MSADTSTPSTHKTAVKATKLKASCDFCALSKIKCDRGQPQCVRCIKNGIPCHYSETRRIGKARQIYAASHTRPSSPTMQMQSPWRPPQQQPSTPRVQQPAITHTPGATRRTPNPPMYAPERYGSSDYTMPLNLFDDILSQGAELIAASPSHARPARTHAYCSGSSDSMVEPFPSPESPSGFLRGLGGEEMVEFEMGGMDHNLTGQLDLESDDRIWGAAVAGPAVIAPEFHGADCIKRACAVLQTLDVARACARSDSPPAKPMQTLDMALKNNRMCMDTVREILDCPCSHGMSLALLLVLITHQVMDSYRTLLTQEQAAQQPPSDASAPEVADLVAGGDVPLAIGGYLLDDDMRSKVIVQVIRSELEKMGPLLDTFAQYAEVMRNQPEEAVLATYIDSLRAGREEISHSLHD